MPHTAKGTFAAAHSPPHNLKAYSWLTLHVFHTENTYYTMSSPISASYLMLLERLSEKMIDLESLIRFET